MIRRKLHAVVLAAMVFGAAIGLVGCKQDNTPTPPAVQTAPSKQILPGGSQGKSPIPTPSPFISPTKKP